MRNFIILFVLFTTGVQAQDLSELYEKVSPAVVVIYTSEEQIVPDSNHQSYKVSQEGLGSGFMISERLIVTAAHVVTVPEEIKVLFPDGDVIPAKVVSFYKNADIALTDLKKLYGEFGENDKINIKTKFEGTINDFILRDIDLKSNRNLQLKDTVRLKDMVEKENIMIDAELDNFSAHYKQLKILLPNLVNEKVPQSFEKIGSFCVICCGTVQIVIPSLLINLSGIKVGCLAAGDGCFLAIREIQ